MASIFIALFDELRSSGRVKEDPSIGDIDAGDIVAVTMGPAVAPLRRVIDQVIRLLDMRRAISSSRWRSARSATSSAAQALATAAARLRLPG
jgi:hypothetical protein